MRLKIRKDLVLPILVVIVLLIQPMLENWLFICSYIDEFLALLMLFYFVKECIKTKKIYKMEERIIFFLFCLLIIGIWGNFQSGTNNRIYAIVLDIFSNCKCFIFTLPLFVRNKWCDEQKEKFGDFINLIIRLIICIMFICAVISQFINIGMTGEVRYGITSFQFVFPNPAGLNTYCYAYAVLFSATLFKNGKIRKFSNLYMIMFLYIWISTLRSRAIAFGAIYFILYFLVVIKGINRSNFKLRWYHIVLIGIVVALIGWQQFAEYFIKNSKQARYVLARSSMEIAKDYFPIGSGFGSFGTAASKTFYSPIYSIYGISSLWGISSDSAYFILDQYWFGIIGQFGIIGFAVVVCLIYMLYSFVWKKGTKARNLQFAAIVFIYTSFISSISASSYVQASILLSLYVIMNLGDFNYKVKR